MSLPRGIALSGAQAQAFKRRLAAVFDRVAGGYDRPALRLFPFAADRTVYDLRIVPGEKVLDVGTGTGAAALAAARLAGPKGRVIGVDIAEGMLDRASANAGRQRITNLDLHAMDAEQIEFRAGYFDAVVCAAAVYLLPDMLQGLKEMWRVLKPGGRLVFTGFGAGALQPMAGLLVKALEEAGVGLLAGQGPLCWQRLGTPHDYASLMLQSGFQDVRVETRQLGYHLASANDWWDVVWYTELRGLVDEVPEDAVGRFRVAHQEVVEGLRSEDGIWLDGETVFALGAKPR
jgi:ubiquinone/menaquinone biosynthesis C-methylase UbiE